MTGVPTAGLLTALGIGEKVCHVSALFWTLVETATLEDAKVISPKPVTPEFPGVLVLGTHTELGGSSCCIVPSMGQ